MVSGRRKSEMWSYFTVKEDAHYAECNKCKEQISRGGRNTKTFNKTNLVQHLRKHKDEFKKYEKEKDTNALKESQTLKQLSLEGAEDRVRPKNSTSDSPPSRNGGLRLSTLFCCRGLEIEPCYTIPSRRYISETILPQIVRGDTDEMKKELQCMEWYSFTTNIWCTEVSNDCLLSLTMHWLTKNFEKRKLCCMRNLYQVDILEKFYLMNTTIC